MGAFIYDTIICAAIYKLRRMRHSSFINPERRQISKEQHRKRFETLVFFVFVFFLPIQQHIDVSKERYAICM